MSHLGKTEIDVHLNASAQKFHEMFTSNPHHIANISPAKIKSVTKLEGDFAKAGSVVVWNYVLDGKEGVAKDVIEAVDSAKNLIIFRVMEGDLLKHYKSFKFIIQVSPKAKGSVAHWTLEYGKLHGRIPDPHTVMQLATELSREIDASLTQGQAQEEQLLGKVGVDVHINASADNFHEMLSSKPHDIPNVSPARIRDAILEGSWGKSVPLLPGITSMVRNFATTSLSFSVSPTPQLIHLIESVLYMLNMMLIQERTCVVFVNCAEGKNSVVKEVI
ncbi:MLP-like protein 43 [Neltuma alba]|uniref:MLP-like protein 43 n=1 Tax=Neltuma alba TaxID=207710 RepID=UPI0010A424DB|nr:MLP-like protein 43 [Prosopis alba]